MSTRALDGQSWLLWQLSKSSEITSQGWVRGVNYQKSLLISLALELFWWTAEADVTQGSPDHSLLDYGISKVPVDKLSLSVQFLFNSEELVSLANDQIIKVHQCGSDQARAALSPEWWMRHHDAPPTGQGQLIQLERLAHGASVVHIAWEEVQQLLSHGLENIFRICHCDITLPPPPPPPPGFLYWQCISAKFPTYLGQKNLQ